MKLGQAREATDKARAAYEALYESKPDVGSPDLEAWHVDVATARAALDTAESEHETVSARYHHVKSEIFHIGERTGQGGIYDKILQHSHDDDERDLLERAKAGEIARKEALITELRQLQ